MLVFTAVLLTIGAFLFALHIREEDLPQPEPLSPFAHLDERKAAIYENLRDLQFEYRLGKLSDHDYQQTKQDLQRELAAVLAERERLDPDSIVAVSRPEPPASIAPAATNVCPHCGASFPKPLKFCGECGKPMAGGAA